MSKTLLDLDNFGEIAAEDDEILLHYFLSTDTVKRVEQGQAFLVIGRKGSGKTAIVRHFSEGAMRDRSVSLNLRNYPWNVHATRIDRGSDAVDAYVASWRYLISIEIASWVVNRTPYIHLDERKELEKFLLDNYGGAKPKLSDIIRPKTLSVTGLKLAPQIFGNAIGSIDLERTEKDNDLGMELSSLTQSIIECSTQIMKQCDLGEFFLHFDELDAGLEEMDETRKRILIGLILAIRGLRREFRDNESGVKPILYLRSDLWDALAFSDKNKITQGQAELIEWSSESLKQLIDARLKAKLGQNMDWNNVIDEKLMRGSLPKWNHIVARTLRRPRDVIQFLNFALNVAKRRNDELLKFTNKDIVQSRNDYSAYLKKELDDEILTHWKHWDEALQTISTIVTETFDFDTFKNEYSKRKSKSNPLDAGEALRTLHKFSVIGYRTRSGYGGSRWVYMYEEPDRGWDALSTQFKVHPGLKEHAGLREERR